MELESAIPEHLREERIIPSSLPPDYKPPFPAYCARFPTSTKSLAIAYLGVQDRSDGRTHAASSIQRMMEFVRSSKSAGPAHFDRAAVMDTSGAYNEVIITYWTDRRGYLDWATDSGFDEWFGNIKPEESGDVGWFREVFLPGIDRFETVFSDNVVPEGAAHMRQSVSGMLQEHVYWGSMRDRLPASQVDDLQGRAWKPESETSSTQTLCRRVRVPGKQNLAVIRSGQDWSGTTPDERKLYLETMHPVLRKGMNFLRDEGTDLGCFSCRFMDVLPTSFSSASSPPDPTDKTFGLVYFDSLASLENWSKQHKTHLDIFGGFLQYAKALDNQVSLRLFHEVVVLEPDQQIFEYVNCHEQSGMLTSM